jgi:hypothetical protein
MADNADHVKFGKKGCVVAGYQLRLCQRRLAMRRYHHLGAITRHHEKMPSFAHSYWPVASTSPASFSSHLSAL